MNYLMENDLRAIADLLSVLNKTLDASLGDISLGPATVYDSNGESVGRIAFTEACGYGYIPDLTDN